VTIRTSVCRQILHLPPCILEPTPAAGIRNVRRRLDGAYVVSVGRSLLTVEQTSLSPLIRRNPNWMVLALTNGPSHIRRPELREEQALACFTAISSSSSFLVFETSGALGSGGLARLFGAPFLPPGASVLRSH
jgi:hypothetical protein